ncbi:AAA family ATPase [Candidatus Saccharibacteria bacterium]|nr:AAA family ATPase [Candidatus Saccharibacteria bacterium]
MRSGHYFVYLRGNPGVGKITVARILEKELDWKVLWFHDLKNAVYNIVKEHRIPRLMDEVTQPVIRHLLGQGGNIIYTRCSPDKVTVDGVRAVVADNPDYIFKPIRLIASYETLLERVEGRHDPYRIENKQDLDEYLNSRETAEIGDELVIDTDGLTPEQVAEKIKAALR